MANRRKPHRPTSGKARFAGRPRVSLPRTPDTSEKSGEQPARVSRFRVSERANTDAAPKRRHFGWFSGFFTGLESGGATDHADSRFARGDTAAVRNATKGRSRWLQNSQKRLEFSAGSNRISFSLGAVVIAACLALILIAQPVYDLVNSIRERNQVVAELQQAKDENADLHRQLQTWQDPDYISAQARERLGYVKPGEVRYRVVDSGENEQKSQRADSGPTRPWFIELQRTLELADEQDTTVVTKNGTPAPGAEPVQSDETDSAQ
ncbi:MAG: septum formation initiator family protein [Varibaculum sp.]|nr:septum formation initiator family protein [Varibaculum sp.]